LLCLLSLQAVQGVKKIASIFAKAGYALKANVSDVDAFATGSRKIKVGFMHCFSHSFLQAVLPFLVANSGHKNGQVA
jgi:hypothetical protein